MKRRKLGLTLVELTLVMVIFAIVLSMVLYIYTDLAKRSNKALEDVEIHSQLFKMDSIIQAELSKAGPNIGKIVLIKESVDAPATGVRYSLSIPFTTGKITEQFYFKDNKLKVWEKIARNDDFPVGEAYTMVDELERNENIIFSTSPLETIRVEFESIGNGSVFYKITLNHPGGVKVHRSSVKLINVK